MCFISKFLCRFKKNPSLKEGENYIHSLSDHPVLSLENDLFHFQDRHVNKIIDDLGKIKSKQMTIALTGEWGAGKTSLIYLLQYALKTKKQNVIINFEPQIEGKLQVSEIISTFYLKLYKHVKSNKSKKYIEACLAGLSITSNIKFMGQIGIPGLVSFGAVFDPNKSAKKIITAYNENTPKEFSEQAKEISKILESENINLYIFIDEIDRLSEDQIINFLIFCRNLELINNSVCFLGMDYEQVLWKLMNERFGGNFSDENIRYKRATNYLDKLFQLKYIVSTDVYTLRNFFINQLKKLDVDNCLTDIYKSHIIDDYNDDILKIISYLRTPRQIKKWLISIQNHYEIIKHSNIYKTKIIFFLAITIKHPVITDYLTKNFHNFIRYKGAIALFASDCYGIKSGDLEQEKIILASIGFANLVKLDDIKKNTILSLMKKMDVHLIDDTRGEKYVLDFFQIPAYLMLLIIHGSRKKRFISIYSEYFNGDVTSVINDLSDDNLEINLFAQDLAADLYSGGVEPKNKPSVDGVNMLWKSKIDPYSLNNYHDQIVLYSIKKYPVEIIISDFYLGISEKYIEDILSVFSVFNDQSIYDLEKLKSPDESKMLKLCLNNAKYKESYIKDYKDGDTIIHDILKDWIKKVDDEFSSENSTSLDQPKILSILYRYNQWSSSLKISGSQNKLSSYVINFLLNSQVDRSKKTILVTALKNEIIAYSEDGILGGGDPMERLFGGRSGEIRSILEGIS